MTLRPYRSFGTIEEYSPEFQEQVKKFKKEWADSLHKVAQEETPAYDGQGKKIIKQRPDGYNYIIESYMRDCLDRNFPGWSWEMAAPLHFLGAEWIVAQGHLIIIDEHLLAFGIIPPVRKFYGTDSVRIQYRTGTLHEPSNIVDVGDNCKQAVTAAMKYAINRLTHIGDDVYNKRIESEGAGSLQDLFDANPDLVNFLAVCKEAGFLVSTIWKIANTTKLSEIEDYKILYEKLVEYRKSGGK